MDIYLATWIVPGYGQVWQVRPVNSKHNKLSGTEIKTEFL